jgi:DNA-binding MarR family transcriptional regulator
MSREKLIAESLGLIRANQVLTDLVDERACQYLGINRSDGRALDVIDQRGRVTAGELARELRMSTGAVTTLVDRLERAGLARRVPDPADRRRVLIEPTERERELGREVYGDPAEAPALYDDWTDEELAVVHRWLVFGHAWLEARVAHVEELLRRRNEAP